MKLDPVASDRLRLLRFPLIVAIIYIHNYFVDVRYATGSIWEACPSDLSCFIRNLISQGFARVAVPLFFLMSGYFLFLGFDWSADGYLGKLRSRVRTLLVPFLFWNAATLLLYIVVQTLPLTRDFLSGGSYALGTLGPWEAVNAIFGITRYPIAYQFWFVRDLMILVLLVPLIHLFLKKIPLSVFCLLFILWFFDLCPLAVPSAQACFFFYAGALLGSRGRDLFQVDRVGLPVTLVYLILVSIDALMWSGPAHILLHRAGLLLGIAATLYATGPVLRRPRLGPFLLRVSGCSFFVFAVHGVLLSATRKIVYRLVTPESDLTFLVLYFTIPLLVAAVAMGIYYLLKRSCPRFLAVVTGER
jgi:surface polysaccharide O-acyltransferase-like enzyme